MKTTTTATQPVCPSITDTGIAGAICRICVLLWLLLVVSGCNTSVAPVPTSNQAAAESIDNGLLVIAHRGASGYRPEHTLAAYQLAIEQGADFIEPDLVPTLDGQLIARHENALAVVELASDGAIKRDSLGKPYVRSATTDVAEREEFAHLLRVRTIDGRKLAGWFSEDFTLAQIQTLYARERIPQLRPENQRFDKLRIPSLEQIIALLQRPQHQQVGMYPELKHPTHFRYGTRSESGQGEAINIDTAAVLTDQLAASRFTDPQRLFIQCFEVETLRRLHHELLPNAGFSAPLVQLFGKLDWQIPDVAFHLHSANAQERAQRMAAVYGPLGGVLSSTPTYEGLLDNLALVARDYAAGVGPRKGDTKRAAEATRKLGLELHPYTVRAEPFFLSRLRGAVADSVAAELQRLSELGATGVFIDQPDLAVQWRAAKATIRQ